MILSGMPHLSLEISVVRNFNYLGLPSVIPFQTIIFSLFSAHAFYLHLFLKTFFLDMCPAPKTHVAALSLSLTVWLGDYGFPSRVILTIINNSNSNDCEFTALMMIHIITMTIMNINSQTISNII